MSYKKSSNWLHLSVKETGGIFNERFFKRILCVIRGGGEHFKIVWERREAEKKSM